MQEQGRFLQRDLSLCIFASDIRLLVAIKHLATTVPVIFQPGSERQQAQIVAAASQWQMPQTAMSGYWQPQSLFKVALPAEF